MAKLRLDPDALQVESFRIERSQPGGGTVRGMSADPAEAEPHTTVVTPLVTEWETCEGRATCDGAPLNTAWYLFTCIPLCTAWPICKFEENQPDDLG
jgi:hypothetical protein